MRFFTAWIGFCLVRALCVAKADSDRSDTTCTGTTGSKVNAALQAAIRRGYTSVRGFDAFGAPSFATPVTKKTHGFKGIPKREKVLESSALIQFALDFVHARAGVDSILKARAFGCACASHISQALSAGYVKTGFVVHHLVFTCSGYMHMVDVMEDGNGGRAVTTWTSELVSLKMYGLTELYEIGECEDYQYQYQYPRVRNSALVMSYNIWNLNANWLIRLELVLQHIHTHDPDVVCFQEVRYEHGVFQHAQLAARLPAYQYVWVQSQVDVDVGKTQTQSGASLEGLLIMSKFEIRGYKAIRLPKVVHGQHHQRLLLLVWAGGRVYANTHASLHQEARAQNALTILEVLKSLAASSFGEGNGKREMENDSSSKSKIQVSKTSSMQIPIVLCGDFNGEYGETGVKEYLEALCDCGQIYGKEDPRGFTFCAHDPVKRIDFIFASMDMTCETTKTIVGNFSSSWRKKHESKWSRVFSSDHRPVYTLISG